MDRSSTIYALSSGSVPAGVAIIRVSGRGVRFVLETMAGSVPAPRRALLRDICAADGTLLDRGLVLFFPAPASFTGEDCAEFHLHGGRAVVAAVLSALSAIAEVRTAEAGEFTRRAFVNGKLDLTAAEALGDLIEAETESQRRLAVANASGRQRDLYAGWRKRLLELRALVEAAIDFSDEGDVGSRVVESVDGKCHALQQEIRAHLARGRDGEIARDGYRVVIAGAPNAGKSSLLNALAGRDVAIVTPEAGTTRDVIEVVLDLGGARVIVADTAGIRDGAGTVESIGIARAEAAALSADLVLSLYSNDTPAASVTSWGAILPLRSKVDLDATPERGISALTGHGIDTLLAEIRTRALTHTSAALGQTVPTRRRHVDLLTACASALAECMVAEDVELKAEALRSAAYELGKLTGDIAVEEILGEVFARFCIGK